MPFDNFSAETSFSLRARLAEHAAVTPQACALSDAQGSCTFKEMYHRVERFAEWISTYNVNCLGIELDNCIDWVIADLAALLAGITVVPIPLFFSEQQRTHVLHMAQVDCLVSMSGESVPGLTSAKCSRVAASSDLGAVKVTFTSGSSGTPKAVVLRHSANIDVARSIVLGMELVDVQRHVCILPLATLLENTAGVYAPLIKGIAVHLASAEESGLSGSSSLDLERFSQCIETQQPESLILVPQLLVALTTLIELGMIKTDDFFKLIAVGGGRVSEGLLTKAKSLGLPVYEGYGLSEAGSVVTLNLPGQEKPGSVGKALHHAEIRTNNHGELEVKGAAMVGYLNEPPLEDAWLKTGDLAEIDDAGFVFIQGRISNRFITSFGRNVNPEWVESELMQRPLIGQALFLGEAQATNLALIWPRFESSSSDIAEIVDDINRDLPDYARVHDFLLMSDVIDPMLMTANGRLKRASALAAHSSSIEQHYNSIRHQSKENQHAVL